MREGICLSVIEIRGLRRLKGKIKIQGSKNAVLPVMAASLLHSGTVEITNVPEIQDVTCMMGILESLGCVCRLEKGDLTICTEHAFSEEIPAGPAGQMRSSIMLLGPLLGRFGRAYTCQPGGCSIGRRPIDLHLKGLQALGTEISMEGEQIRAYCTELCGSEVTLPYPSVGATENVIMAAVAARGTTVLHGAAREPEIEILCRFLESMGASVSGVGTSKITIEGSRSLRDTSFRIPGDRIVAGTYLGAVMAAGGEVFLEKAPVAHMLGDFKLAERMGAKLTNDKGDGVLVTMDKRPVAADFVTGPYPEFSTDLQSVMMAVASVAEGVSHIRETVFENRFSTAKELQKLGAHIIIDGRTAQVEGICRLLGGDVQAADLRGGAALVVAGLAAERATKVRGYKYIRRGYEDICRDLAGVGADITLIDGDAGSMSLVECREY